MCFIYFLSIYLLNIKKYLFIYYLFICYIKKVMSYWNKTGSRQCTRAIPPNSMPFINFNAQELAAACAKELAHVGLQLLEVEKDADELFKWCAQDFTAFIGKKQRLF